MRSSEKIREKWGEKKTSPEEERQEQKGGRKKQKLIKNWNENKDERREEKGKGRGEKRPRNMLKDKSMLLFANASPEGNGIYSNLRTSELRNNG